MFGWQVESQGNTITNRGASPDAWIQATSACVGPINPYQLGPLGVGPGLVDTSDL